MKITYRTVAFFLPTPIGRFFSFSLTPRVFNVRLPISGKSIAQMKRRLQPVLVSLARHYAVLKKTLFEFPASGKASYSLEALSQGV
jgi:hypothetical protein